MGWSRFFGTIMYISRGRKIPKWIIVLSCLAITSQSLMWKKNTETWLSNPNDLRLWNHRSMVAADFAETRCWGRSIFCRYMRYQKQKAYCNMELWMCQIASSLSLHFCSLNKHEYNSWDISILSIGYIFSGKMMIYGNQPNSFLV